MTDFGHPDHGEIVETTLDSRVHGDIPCFKCTRCNMVIPQDESEEFDTVDCDRYKEMKESITGSL